MRKLAVILIATVCCVTPSFAQAPDPAGVVAHVLDLTSDQIVQWSKILQARHPALEPIAQQVPAKQKAVADALASPVPDPLAVGQAVVALHDLQAQIAAINSDSAAQFEKILTPDQLQRLNGIRGAAQVCPIVPAFQATGLLGI